MLISAVCRVTFLLLLGLAPLPAAALSMAFINPGKSDEPYWSLASAAMQQAADSLGIHLEILTAERNYLAQIHLVETLGERPRQERPDYVIVVAEKATLVPQLMAAERADIPVFLAFNSVIGPAHEQVGFPVSAFVSGWAVWYRWPRREAISPPAHSFRQPCATCRRVNRWK